MIVALHLQLQLAVSKTDPRGQDFNPQLHPQVVVLKTIGLVQLTAGQSHLHDVVLKTFPEEQVVLDFVQLAARVVDDIAVKIGIFEIVKINVQVK